MAERHQVFCTLLMAMAWSSFSGVVIRYILPVLSMASCFHVASCAFLSGDRLQKRNGRDSNQILLSDKDQQVLGVKSAIYDFLVN